MEYSDIIPRKSLDAGGKGQARAVAFNPSLTAGSRDSIVKVDWLTLPVILDSPLTSRFTQAHCELAPFWDNETRECTKQGRKPLAFEQLLTVDIHQAHLAMARHLAQTARPAIVIAGNGMCSSGRIVNYIKAMLHDPRHDVLFIGYQAQGTPGRAIQMYGERGGYVDFDHERYKIGAKINTIGGYSAHADQKGLVGFVTGMRHWPSQVRIVHGEPSAKHELGERLRALYKKAQRNLQLLIPSGTNDA